MNKIKLVDRCLRIRDMMIMLSLPMIGETGKDYFLVNFFFADRPADDFPSPNFFFELPIMKGENMK